MAKLRQVSTSDSRKSGKSGFRGAYLGVLGKGAESDGDFQSQTSNLDFIETKKTKTRFHA